MDNFIKIEVLLKAAEYIEKQQEELPVFSLNSENHSFSKILNQPTTMVNFKNVKVLNNSINDLGRSANLEIFNKCIGSKMASKSEELIQQSNIFKLNENDKNEDDDDEDDDDDEYSMKLQIVDSSEEDEEKKSLYSNNSFGNASILSPVSSSGKSREDSNPDAAGNHPVQLSTFKLDQDTKLLGICKSNRSDVTKRNKKIHNILEKNRRDHLKECFENLQNVLPLYKEKKVTNLLILKHTLKYVEQTKKIEKEFRKEIMDLLKYNLELHQNLTRLRNELEKENIDFNHLVSQSSVNYLNLDYKNLISLDENTQKEQSFKEIHSNLSSNSEESSFIDDISSSSKE